VTVSWIASSPVTRRGVNHYEPESKRQSVEWQHLNFPSKKKFKSLPSVGKVTCTVFRDRKGGIILDFLEPGKPSTLTTTL
jgi:hypothetical protein